jgi:glucose-6-phosphate 1-dehydrogenase
MVATTITNPLREGLRIQRMPEPCVMVIFGASGDLTRRKLLPALYNLVRERLLPGGFTVVGVARRPIGTDAFREQMKSGINDFSRVRPVREAIWESFAQGIYYHQAEFHDPEGYARLKELLDQIDRERGTAGNRIFYLATAPSYYDEIIRHLGEHGLAHRAPPGGTDDHPWQRIIIEKPFGHDLDSARELNNELAEVFAERQVFRIDHYLGKETVQNILVFRFANGIFEPLWNRNFVDHVQFTVAESIGVEGRGGYYEESGALRDMVQNHMLQLLSLVCMEPPISNDATGVRDEKVKVLQAIRPIHPEDVDRFVVRGQYGPGEIGGRAIPGYREEQGVPPNSTTETFVAAKFFIDNWRWADVPFYLRTGKALPKRVTEVAIQFKPAPHLLFEQAADSMEPNVLALQIQPDEGISIKFGSKVPGPMVQIRSVNMDFKYGTYFGIEPPDAYERLLLDCMIGDSTLFTRRDEVEVAWSLISAIHEGWRLTPPPQFPNYAAGTWGPERAHDLLARDNRSWRRLRAR